MNELLTPGTEVKFRVTGDMLIDYCGRGLVLVQRRFPPFQDYWAIPGGHINIGKENPLECSIREAREETNLYISPDIVRFLGVYGDPDRDPRGHYITTAYYCTVYKGILRAMDDAKKIGVFPLDRLPRRIAFDHPQIIEDYRAILRGGGR